MTANKATLTALFQQNDVPQGSDYANFIDSYVNVVETSVQTMAGALSCTELITPRISANNVVFGGTSFQAVLGTNFIVSAGNLTSFSTGSTFKISAGSNCLIGAGSNCQISAGGNLTGYGDTQIFFSGGGSSISLTGVNSSFISVGDLSLGAAAGSNINLSSNTVLASGAFISQAPVVVSAAGTTQGTAAVLTKYINRGKGVADGVTTGFTPLANRAGIVQYLYNEGASANLWPPVGGTINGLAVNAAFPLAASAMVTIVHLTASAMAVK
jgi:hypothetical protein